MNLESLKFFYEIAKAGNISTVAKQAHISQSALSQQINRLESDFSGRLLERSNKGVSLTEKGEVVFKFAKNMLRTYDEMINEIDHLNSTEPIIKVEACNSIANYALPCTLVLANKEFPKHHYELKSRASTDIFSDVSNNICDIGFSYQTDKTPSQKDIISIKTGYNKIILVGKNNRTNPDVMPIHKLLKSCLITFTGRNDID